MAKLETTERIPGETVESLVRELEGLIPVTETQRVILRSADPPSWIQLLASAAEWQLILKGAVAAYLVAVAKEAGVDTWRAGKKVSKALAASSAKKLKAVASAFVNAKKSSVPNTRILIGLNFPDPKYGTVLEIQATTPEEASLSIAIFISRCQEIQDVLEEAVQSGSGPAMAVQIQINERAEVELQWSHEKSFETIVRSLNGNTAA